MVTWIVVAVCVLAVVVLALAVVSVLRRVGGLLDAAEGLQPRQRQALGLQARAETLAATVQGLAGRAETMQERITVLRAARGKAGQVPRFLTRRTG